MIKKAYRDIVELLENNKTETVANILPQVIELASAKSGGSKGAQVYLKDTAGNPAAILCYYFKRWMPLVGDLQVEFGKKASTAHGLNTMCKEGMSNWTRQQNEAKKATMDILNRVRSGELAPEGIEAEEARIEEGRKAIVPTDLGFETKEDVVAYLADNGVELAEV